MVAFSFQLNQCRRLYPHTLSERPSGQTMLTPVVPSAPWYVPSFYRLSCFNTQKARTLGQAFSLDKEQPCLPPSAKWATRQHRRQHHRAASRPPADGNDGRDTCNRITKNTSQTKPNRTKPNQTKPNQTKPDHTSKKRLPSVLWSRRTPPRSRH